MEAFSTDQPITSSGSRMPQSPRRPTQQLPSRMSIALTSDLGPHAQRNPVRRQSVGRVPQLTPTLVVPHRSEGLDNSSQVAGVPRFRFGFSDDSPQTSSSSHSDLGHLASQGGLGMFESPLFLAPHEEESGGRSVPTTPLQVTAPVNIFSEAQSDSTEHASQSVPIVSMSTPGGAGSVEDRDDALLEPDSDRPSGDMSGDSVVSQGDVEESGQQFDKASLPSTSQEPPSSSADTSRAPPRPSRPGSSRQLQRWPEHRGGRMKRGGQGFPSRGLHGRRFAR